jgi:hypothetical protein
MNAIRLAAPEDAAALLALQHRLDGQSSFMMLEPGEREREPGRLRARLEAHGEGLRRRALIRDGAVIDEYYMARLP